MIHSQTEAKTLTQVVFKSHSKNCDDNYSKVDNYFSSARFINDIFSGSCSSKTLFFSIKSKVKSLKAAEQSYITLTCNHIWQ